MHAKVDCRSCHVKLVFKDVGMKCADCHADLHRGQMGAQCEKCHTVNGWNASIQAVQDHQNRFPLVGAHALVECSACHTNAAVGKFQGLSTDCVACHLTNFRNTKTSGLDHAALNFPTHCQSCHSMDTWLGASFDHAKVTGFALVGAHARLDCTACHVGGRFAGVPADCYSCHVKEFTFAANPNHVAGGFPHDCTMCHSMASWQGATFDHSKFTQFPLTGAHASVACTSCHIGGKFTGTPTDCYSCHKPDFVGTTNPSHVAAGFPTDCTVCHTTANWTRATFDHSKFTKFPLTGGHVNIPCTSCHVGGKFAGTPADCYSCHKPDFAGTTNPNHVAAGFPTNCSVCHTTANWSGATFNHNNTPFPLTGAHLSVGSCSTCHVGGVYAGLSTACMSCHLKDYNGTTNPNHAASGIPQTCEVCHTTLAWTPATFDHSKTPFPLTGAHAGVACSSCHIGGKYAGTPTDCYSCHKPDFVGTTNPNHVAAGFPTDCSVCHSTVNWAGATFNHNNTPFPLTGAHLTVGSCATCHVGGVYAGLSTACVSCHLKDYNGTTNPNHAASGIPQTCEVCHTTTAWSPATFDHSQTPFPLTGAHVTVPCASCHVGGKYAGTPTDCYSCHKPDYLGTTNPNHAAAGFPTTCLTCHTTTAWTGATFNHTWFPVPHRTATLCVDCHTNPSNYAVFVCTNCHTQATTDPHHTGVAGYVWNSTNCYSCHPTGTTN